MARDEELIARLADLEEDEVLAIVRRRVASGADPLRIVQECEQGVREVGERYARREYYIAGLIMGGEIFREVVAIVEPLFQGGAIRRTSGKVLLGTVKGDIHDIGKNLVHILLRCHGFTVQDLGVDVAPSEFAAAVRETRPDIVGLSGLLTVAYDTMRETVAVLRSEITDGQRVPPIIIGGGLIDEKVCRYIGADRWAPDALSGVHLCEQLITATMNPEFPGAPRESGAKSK